MKNFISAIVGAVLLFAGCSTGGVTESTMPTEPSEEIAVDYTEEKVESIMRDMSIEEKIYQMMFVTEGSIKDNRSVGGIIYFAENLKNRQQTIDMIADAQNFSKIPLFIGVDEEGGRVSRLGSNPNMGTTRIGAMKNVKDVKEAYNVGAALGTDLKALGFNLDFAPVADVIVYDKNSEIGDRSFGSDPVRVAEMVQEVVRGLEDNAVSSVLKHFPGHGSTRTNSHTGYSESQRSIDELRMCEFLPFKSGIDAGCDFVMVSHMTLVNATEEKVASSLSYEVIEGMLKGELGFDGIVITDSLSMGAITEEFDKNESSVKAIKAGCDMLLMPPDPVGAKDAILNAISDGVLTVERIDESVRKILTVKVEKGIIL